MHKWSTIFLIPSSILLSTFLPTRLTPHFLTDYLVIGALASRVGSSTV